MAKPKEVRHTYVYTAPRGMIAFVVSIIFGLLFAPLLNFWGDKTLDQWIAHYRNRETHVPAEPPEEKLNADDLLRAAAQRKDPPPSLEEVSRRLRKKKQQGETTFSE